MFSQADPEYGGRIAEKLKVCLCSYNNNNNN